MDPEDILYGAHWILLWPVSRLADFSLMRAHLLRLLPDQGLGATVRLARHPSGVLAAELRCTHRIPLQELAGARYQLGPQQPIPFASRSSEAKTWFGSVYTNPSWRTEPQTLAPPRPEAPWPTDFGQNPF